MNMSRAPCWDLLFPWHPRESRDCPPFPHGLYEPKAGVGGSRVSMSSEVCPRGQAVPTLPLGDLAVAMRDERRAPLLVEGVGVLLWVTARRSRRLPSSLGVLRMLNAIDWRL